MTDRLLAAVDAYLGWSGACEASGDNESGLCLDSRCHYCRLARAYNDACSIACGECGSDPGVNIDCPQCEIEGSLLAEEIENGRVEALE